MKTFNVLLAAAALSTLATSAFASDVDFADRQAFLSQLSGQPVAQTVVEGRQAAQANVAPSANDQLLIGLANARNVTNH